MNRRNFIKGICSFAGASFMFLPEIAKGNGNNLSHKAKLQMGTYVNISICHHDNDLKKQGFQLAFEEIDRLENLLTYQKPSPLSELNTKGFLSQPPFELAELMEISLKLAHQTHGAFNPWVLRALEVMEQEKVSSIFHLPQSMQKDLEKLGDYKEVSCTSKKIEFSSNSMKCSLCGIAKGYIVGKASALLLNLGIENFLIDAGGDVYAHGMYGLNQPWQVGIADEGTKKMQVISLYNSALATSGNVFSNHIVSLSAEPFYTASILHTSPTWADAYATACMGANYEKVTDFVRNNKIPAMLQKKEGIAFDTLT